MMSPLLIPRATDWDTSTPPVDSPKGWHDEHEAPRWIYDFWEYLLRIALKLYRKAPDWRERPQMMRMTVTTFNVLKSLREWEGFRAFNFFLLPVLAGGGYPANVSPKHFRLVAPFESDQRKWNRSRCINIGDPEDRRMYGLITSFTSTEYGKKAVVETFENLFYRYMQHPEAKSLGPDGEPSTAETRGLLGRSHIIAGRHRRIGKESDRRWEEGDNLESLLFAPLEYQQPGEEEENANLVLPSERLIRRIKKIGIRRLVRFGCGRRILDRICGRDRISISRLREYERMVEAYRRS